MMRIDVEQARANAAGRTGSALSVVKDVEGIKRDSGTPAAPSFEAVGEEARKSAEVAFQDRRREDAEMSEHSDVWDLLVRFYRSDYFVLVLCALGAVVIGLCLMSVIGFVGNLFRFEVSGLALAVPGVLAALAAYYSALFMLPYPLRR